ncbi:hypothetical protein MYP_3855 [Sporocytophaga myxococcoides]|uniref:DinB-like domain-containing protein n=1 Tax=Sporocytophaga myxococcoides TaxID=153721 RepID=A0A098LI34_9BACT|nr:DinB family protein [Sporocytophaga myxococcoides]GAL86625.1 hypothetical protein MYP_3855 [Sporocytophaga myxococcoides]
MIPETELSKLKFPIGPFVSPSDLSTAELDALVKTIEEAPSKYRELAKRLSPSDLAKTYREGSWNVHQLYNHVADIQLVHYFRMKKAITENDYKEITLINIDAWAHTRDNMNSPIDDSLLMFEGIAKRFAFLIRSLTPEQLELSYYHPFRKITLNQKQAIAMAAWHVKHHYAHLLIATGLEE